MPPPPVVVVEPGTVCIAAGDHDDFVPHLTRVDTPSGDTVGDAEEDWVVVFVRDHSDTAFFVWRGLVVDYMNILDEEG